jgi:hypothetical protein
VRQAERARLGLLGRLTVVDCFIEVYSDAPGAEELRACLTKHLASWQQRVRVRDVSVAPFLWISAAGVPRPLLTKLKLERSQVCYRVPACGAANHTFV